MSSTNRAQLLKDLAELAAKQEAIKAQLAAARDDELKSLVVSFKEQLESNDFTVEEALELLTTAKKTRAKRGSVVRAPKEFIVGTTYKNPKGGETWVGGTKGRKPQWLAELLANGATFESLAS